MRVPLLSSILVLALAWAAGACAERPQRLQGFHAVEADNGEVEAEIIERTNAFRVRNGLQPVRENETLTAEARRFAAYMARTHTFSHTADGSDPAARAAAAGYAYCGIAENIAYEEVSRGSLDSEAFAGQFVEGWEKSPGHRRNMLNAEVVETGVGVSSAPSGPDRRVAVQVFGRPLSTQTVFEVANRSPTLVSYTVAGRRQTVEPGETITHTVCSSAPLAFDVAAGRQGPSFDIENGAAYLIRPDRGGGLMVDVVRRAPAHAQSARRGRS